MSTCKTDANRDHLHRAFTIEDALRIKTFADRAPIRLSADGQFLAYTVECRDGKACLV